MTLVILLGVMLRKEERPGDTRKLTAVRRVVLTNVAVTSLVAPNDIVADIFLGFQAIEETPAEDEIVRNNNQTKKRARAPQSNNLCGFRIFISSSLVNQMKAEGIIAVGPVG